MLTQNEKVIMRSILQTLIYNSFSDLVYKYTAQKDNLSEEALELLLFGDNLVTDTGVRSISLLEHRWCLKSILDYHLNMTHKITKKEYDSFFGL